MRSRLSGTRKKKAGPFNSTKLFFRKVSGFVEELFFRETENNSFVKDFSFDPKGILLGQCDKNYESGTFRTG